MWEKLILRLGADRHDLLTLAAFNASLAIVGVLLVTRNPTYSGELPMVFAMELRGMLDTAMEILYGLDQGNNTTIMKCRDTLQRILRAIDNNGIVNPLYLKPTYAYFPTR